MKITLTNTILSWIRTHSIRKFRHIPSNIMLPSIFHTQQFLWKTAYKTIHYTSHLTTNHNIKSIIFQKTHHAWKGKIVQTKNIVRGKIHQKKNVRKMRIQRAIKEPLEKNFNFNLIKCVINIKCLSIKLITFRRTKLATRKSNFTFKSENRFELQGKHAFYKTSWI
jgi:hypothetical protein